MNRAYRLAATTAPIRCSSGYRAIRGCDFSNTSIPLTMTERATAAPRSPQGADLLSKSSTEDSSSSSSILSGASKGVYRESESADIMTLVNNFTAPAIAKALRERETSLQKAATLAESDNYAELKQMLKPFLHASVEKRRTHNHELDLSQGGFRRKDLVIIQRYLSRMPRFIFQAASKRASVVIPLCNVKGEACVLFERRSTKVRTHKQDVCFPGGMVDEEVDATIIQTSIREMEEELGIAAESIEVLGIVRCNWQEVSSLTGVAVTPVVGFVGDLESHTLSPNPDEVEQLFTVPVKELLNQDKWIKKDHSAPAFTGGPFVIWGLTGYILDKFVTEVLRKCNNEERM